MKKIRIYELAKEMDMTSKDLMEMVAKEFDMEIASHMSTLEAEQAEIIKAIMLGEDEEVKEEKVEVKKQEQAKKEIKQEPKKKSEEKPVKKEVVEQVKKEEVKTEQKEEVKTDTKKEAQEEKSHNKKNKNKKDKKHKNKAKNSKIETEEIKPKETNQEGDELAIEIGESIIVKDLAEKLGVNASELIKKLIFLGVMANQNQSIDFDTASIVAGEFGVELIKIESEEVEEDELEEEFNLDFEDDEKDLQSRPPIVTVMGHVDHGKTSLLDAIKKTNVTGGEAGGITQHMGAYIVEAAGRKISFLDTPGHEAFTAMRARGTQITDIVILVVAADDGVMPQTIEAINHVKAANVPLIVAINKVDLETANVEKVKQELAENNLIAEDWGGDTIVVPISAKTRQGLDELLEMVLLVSEMEDLKANPNRTIVGSVVEAKLDTGKGPMATILVQKGTLRVGDTVVSGKAIGRVRAMFDDKGNKIKEAGPSIPAVVLGLSETPNAGDFIYSVENEKIAKTYIDKKKVQVRESEIRSDHKVSLEDLFDRIKLGELKDLNIIIKADVKGSIEALGQSLEKLDTDEVRINILHGGVGGITEGDIMLASASNAIVIGFNVRPNLNAMDAAKREKVDVKTYRVIYEAIEDIQAAVKGMHAPKIVEEVTGRAEVRDTFKLPSGTIVAGIYVVNGKILRKGMIRLLRDDVVIHEGDIASLRRFKDDVAEVANGYEAGLGVDGYNDIKVGDFIEAYIEKEVKN